MDTLSYKTRSVRNEDVQREWYIIDAEGEKVGRISSRIAAVLRGKHKPTFTPHTDCGDNVIVINADKIRFTGDKWNQKEYATYSHYPGGRKTIVAKDLLIKKPGDILEIAVKGMLPKNRLGRAMFKKLYVYSGPKHPHQAQKPQPFQF